MQFLKSLYKYFKCLIRNMKTVILAHDTANRIIAELYIYDKFLYKCYGIASSADNLFKYYNNCIVVCTVQTLELLTKEERKRLYDKYVVKVIR